MNWDRIMTVGLVLLSAGLVLMVFGAPPRALVPGALISVIAGVMMDGEECW